MTTPFLVLCWLIENIVVVSVSFTSAYLCCMSIFFLGGGQMIKGGFHRFTCENSLCRRYLRLHFLQQVPSTCTGSESSEQLAGGQKILRHSTTPFWKKMIYLFLTQNMQTSKANACQKFACGQKNPQRTYVSYLPLCLSLPLHKHSWYLISLSGKTAACTVTVLGTGQTSNG